MLTIIRQQFGRHGLDSPTIEEVQKQGFDDIVPVVPQSDPGDAVLSGKLIQGAATEPGTQSTGRAPFRHNPFDHTVGVLFDDMKGHTHFFQILR